MSRNNNGFGVFASSVLLGLPGLMIFGWGLLASLVSFMPGAEVDIAGSDRPIVGFIFGLVALAVGTLLVRIPVRMRRRNINRRNG